MGDFLEFELGGTVKINGVPYLRNNRMFALCPGSMPWLRSVNPDNWPSLSLMKNWHSAACAMSDTLVDREFRDNLFRAENHIGCLLCNGHQVVPRGLDCPIYYDMRIKHTPEGFFVEYVPQG